MKRDVILLVFLAGLFFLLMSLQKQPIPKQASQAQVPSPAPALSQPKTSGCVVHDGMPDTSCTPGATLPVTKDSICTPGYSKNVRNVPESEKEEVYAEYGIATHTSGEYEVDHLISLELGGSNDITNLWPEAAEPKPGFHEKDKVENYLHEQVCSGAMDLTQAQQLIAHKWLSVYQQISP